ncbi:hypothetical protein OSE20_002877 [Listeria innocua]|nr:hypothetical protein [Listeria innocua]EKD7152057.1 hypothetical protein [Listeria innocua]
MDESSKSRKKTIYLCKNEYFESKYDSFLEALEAAKEQKCISQIIEIKTKNDDIVSEKEVYTYYFE